MDEQRYHGRHGGERCTRMHFRNPFRSRALRLQWLSATSAVVLVMLSKRIIACLDVRDGQVVKGVNFEGLRVGRRSGGAGAPLQRSKGSTSSSSSTSPRRSKQRRALADTIRAVARELFIPLAVGGGIRTEADAAAAVDAGADKVSLNTAALVAARRSSRRSRDRYGSQAVDRRDRREARQRRSLRRLRAQRPDGAGPRRRRVGARGGGARRRRDPADVDRSRRHEGRLRLRDDRRRVARPSRFRSSRPAAPARSTLRRRLHRPAAPTPRSPRRSFTTRKPASALKQHLQQRHPVRL